MSKIAPLNGVEDFIRLLERVFANGIEALLAVPRAAAWSTQASHDGDRLLEQLRRAGRIGGYVRLGRMRPGVRFGKVHAPLVYLAISRVHAGPKAGSGFASKGYTRTAMLLWYATLIAGLAGLAAGSFLNVCVSRWPEEKSVIRPASYCPSCDRPLKWWENIPLVSWLALGGRCRSCQAWIGWRHPIVELAVGGLWAYTAWQTLSLTEQRDFAALSYTAIVNGVAQLIFLWLLVGLAALDTENFWLPDRLIFPGILLGLVLAFARPALDTYYISGGFAEWKHRTGMSVSYCFLGLVIQAAILLAIRYLYRWSRGREGMGAGDVKLMAMLGGWLGVKVGLFALAIGVVTAAAYALILVLNPHMRGDSKSWLEEKVPFGTFLALGGIVAGLWGVPIVTAYMAWAGLGQS